MDIKNSFTVVTDEALELYLYGEIGYDVTAEGVAATLKAYPDSKKIVVRINSPGGTVTDGMAIFNILRADKRVKECYVDGMAASMASVIAMVDKLYMPANTFLMIHNPWTTTAGNAEQLKHDAVVLEKMQKQLVDIYVAKTGLPSDRIQELLDAETWLTAEEAFELGFTDEVIPVLKAVAKLDVDMSKFTAKVLDERVKALIEGANDGHVDETTLPKAVEAPGTSGEVPSEAEKAEGQTTEGIETPAVIDPRDAKLSELNDRISLLEAEVAAFIEQKKMLIVQLDEAKAKAADLEAKLDASKREFAESKVQYDSMQRKHEALLAGGFAFEAELTWPEVLAKCGNDYAKARKEYPAVYAAYMSTKRPSK